MDEWGESIRWVRPTCSGGREQVRYTERLARSMGLIAFLGLNDVVLKIFNTVGIASLAILLWIILALLLDIKDKKLSTIVFILIIVSCVYVINKFNDIRETEYNRGYDDGIEEADNTHYFDYDEGYEDGFYDGTENNEWGYSYNN